jgi:WhiB family redox-sensing transcriptional regulator
LSAGESALIANLLEFENQNRWQQQGDCRKPERGLTVGDFFPDTSLEGDGHVDPRVWEACAACPVAQECLDHAINNGEMYGVWGGKLLTPRRFYQLRREMRKAHRNKINATLKGGVKGGRRTA